MPFFITPGLLTRRAELFHQISQLTSAGISLTKTGGLVSRSLRGREARVFGQEFERQIEQGATATDALCTALPWLTDFETAMIEAGEKSGRLDDTFMRLSNHYADRARMARQIIGDLAYPVFLYHFAVLIQPFPALFLTGNVYSYALQVGGGLLPFYAIGFFVMLSLQSQQFPVIRDLFERFTQFVPIVGTARRSLALARLSAALEALITAGVTIIQAWELAAKASGSPALLRTVTSWRPMLEAGTTPAELVNHSRLFPEIFANFYSTGEVTGRTDDSLRRIHSYYLDEGTRKIHAVCQWVPRIIYLIIVLLIASQIVSFYTGYFNRVNQF
jgi:type II secretory pathway component PulF